MPSKIDVARLPLLEVLSVAAQAAVAPLLSELRVAPGAAVTCVTSIGTCRMSSAVPAGSYCVCASPQGPVAGRAR